MTHHPPPPNHHHHPGKAHNCGGTDGEDWKQAAFRGFASERCSGDPGWRWRGGNACSHCHCPSSLLTSGKEQNSFGNILNVDHLFSGPGAGIVLRSPSSCPWRGRAGTALPLGWTSAQGQNVLSSDQTMPWATLFQNPWWCFMIFCWSGGFALMRP